MKRRGEGNSRAVNDTQIIPTEWRPEEKKKERLLCITAGQFQKGVRLQAVIAGPRTRETRGR